MLFTKLNETIPYVTGGKLKILEMHPYLGITLRLPGCHGSETNGGDFVVCVSDETVDWTEHQFTHTDLFRDLALKVDDVPNATEGLLLNYLDVIQGNDPDGLEYEFTEGIFDGLGLHPKTFLYAVQCLAVAEHRRYAKFESKFGGRYLPFRFAAGIVEGKWDQTDAANMQKKGRPGVEILEKIHGKPLLTQKLMS